jgi:hypothetical protein
MIVFFMSWFLIGALSFALLNFIDWFKGDDVTLGTLKLLPIFTALGVVTSLVALLYAFNTLKNLLEKYDSIVVFKGRKHKKVKEDEGESKC